MENENQGEPVRIPAATKPQYTIEFDLPSGKHCKLRKGKGRDVRLAMMAAGPRADGYKLSMALLAQLALVDDKIVPFEAIDDWDMEDVFALMANSQEVLRPLVASARAVSLEPAGPIV